MIRQSPPSPIHRLPPRVPRLRQCRCRRRKRRLRPKRIPGDLALPRDVDRRHLVGAGGMPASDAIQSGVDRHHGPGGLARRPRKMHRAGKKSGCAQDKFHFPPWCWAARHLPPGRFPGRFTEWYFERSSERWRPNKKPLSAGRAKARRAHRSQHRSLDDQIIWRKTRHRRPWP